MKKDKHPIHDIEIAFTEEDHKYTDSFGNAYISATTLLKTAFVPFDAVKIASKVSVKQGVPAEQLIAEWEQNGKEASSIGTRVHENCERQFLGQFDKMHKPSDEAERQRFFAAWNIVEKIKSMNHLKIETEKILFSPRFMVAGQCDLLVQNSSLEYSIFDYKIVKKMKKEGFNGQTGCHVATTQIKDSNYWHYALQLNIYEQILKHEKYIPFNATVNKTLLVYEKESSNNDFQMMPMPTLPYEAITLLAYNATCEFMPF